jgi:hypothetical protein
MSRYYVGLDVHKASISIAVLDQEGKQVVESAVETSAATVLTFPGGLRGHVEVAFEEGTHATAGTDARRGAGRATDLGGGDAAPVPHQAA